MQIARLSESRRKGANMSGKAHKNRRSASLKDHELYTIFFSPLAICFFVCYKYGIASLC